jgi:hypothetical protein
MRCIRGLLFEGLAWRWFGLHVEWSLGGGRLAFAWRVLVGVRRWLFIGRRLALATPDNGYNEVVHIRRLFWTYPLESAGSAAVRLLSSFIFHWKLFEFAHLRLRVGIWSSFGLPWL